MSLLIDFSHSLCMSLRALSFTCMFNNFNASLEDLQSLGISDIMSANKPTLSYIGYSIL